MKSILNIVSIVLFFIFLTVTACFTRVGTSTPYLSAQEEDSLLRDAELVAAEQGISIDEALYRFKITNEVGPLGAELEKNELATFAGCWMQYEPEFRFVIAFTENGEETIKKYVKEDSPLGGLIEIRTLQFSRTELLNAQQQMSSSLRRLGLPDSTELVIKNNCVNVYVIDRAVIENSIRDGGLIVPDCVRIITVVEQERLEEGRTESSPQDDNELKCSQWWLISINGSEVIGNVSISLHILNDWSVVGFTGCNEYYGYCYVKSPVIHFSVGQNLLGCNEDLLKQEKTYLNYLRNATSYFIDNDSLLKLYDDSKQALIIFERWTEYPMNPDDLIGTSWCLFSVNDEQVEEEESGTLVFDEDGVSLHGLDRVHTYEYSYEAEGDTIVITSRSGGRIREPSGEFMHGRHSLIGNIYPIISYRLIDDQLEIYTYRGIKLTFQSVDSS